LQPRRRMTSGDDGRERKREEEDEKHLQTFLQEIRILVPGAQIIGGFLFSVPFQQRFEILTSAQRDVFAVVFVSTMLALVLFLAPAAYHRVVWPIREKRRFVAFGTRFVLAGFVSLAVSIVLSAYLVSSIVLGDVAAAAVALAFASLLGIAWWILPWRRAHESR
jgi:hypothetical protein